MSTPETKATLTSIEITTVFSAPTYEMPIPSHIFLSSLKDTKHTNLVYDVHSGSEFLLRLTDIQMNPVMCPVNNITALSIALASRPINPHGIVNYCICNSLPLCLNHRKRLCCNDYQQAYLLFTIVCPLAAVQLFLCDILFNLNQNQSINF